MTNHAKLAAITLLTLTGGLGLLAGWGEAPATPAPAPALADAFSVDSVHSHVVFKIKHLNVSYSYGRFNKTSGTFNLDPADAAGSSIDISIDANSVDTQAPKRDEHLKSPDFFSVSEFPKLTFKSTAVKHTTGNTFEVKGDITIHGVTKPITVNVELVGTGPGMQNKGTVAGIHSEFTVKRSDFGMNFMPGGLGEDVHVIVSLEGGKK